MEQFRQLGEALGSVKALMLFKDSVHLNQRQCCLLLDFLSFAYDSVAEEMKQNLRFEEKHTRWKVLDQPLRDLNRVFKEAEWYIRQCLETKDWWAKAIMLYQNTDCIELHIHNLLYSITVVVEAIETAGENSGSDHDDMLKKRLINSIKYRREHKDLKIFKWKFGKQYLITQDFCNRMDAVWNEDRWVLLNKIREKKFTASSKYEQRLTDLLLKNLDGPESLNGKLLPSSMLVGSRDYQVRRRLGGGSQYKEILWLGESFAMRHFFGEIESLIPEISMLLSLSHPNITRFLCGFTDEEKKECFLIMELMSRDLSSYVKEICGPRKRMPFPLPVALDLMLQIARGMEYLHSKKIYHGDLNPCNILVKPRAYSTDGYVHAQVSGFGLPVVKFKNSSNQNESLPFIWYAPEVLEEQDQSGSAESSKYTEKSDVYSFGMVCFEVLTGKVPFEDSHLQGDKMSRNIRAGERPLFPHSMPKYVTNLTKRCWHTDPNQRPSFPSICRILRYTKRFVAMNPDYNSQTDPAMPTVDYCDIESGLLRRLPSCGISEASSAITDIPFQMFAYRIVEKEKAGANIKDTSESGSDASACGDETTSSVDDPFPTLVEKKLPVSREGTTRRLSLTKNNSDIKLNKLPGTPKGRFSRPPQISPRGRSMRMNSESQLMAMSPKVRRLSGHASDSELP
ncbi:mitogen-activated protein kinase kinase kinase 7-like [Benincasa hispida]|uniref:mitogen-activated protein kinase kinase kinase 7-like n=1 Tax=Benincasa hispida TaxID=102211 RepID=UPI001900CFE0|nr:mitogen-activated protein kinase kinase kinase 7-like [Benincasa hispida]